MKLHIFESTHFGLRSVKALAIIYKSVKQGIPRKFQKTWNMKTVAPEFTIKELKPTIEAEAKRWEAKVLATVKKTKQCQKECEEEQVRLGLSPAQTATPGAVHPPPALEAAGQFCRPIPLNTIARLACE